MSRRRKAHHREIQPDNVYDSVRVSKFINGLMRNGKKSHAEGIFYGALQILEEKTGKPGLEIFEKAITEVKPLLEIKSRRVGGATYQVPVEVREGRRVTLAIRWIVLYTKLRKGNSMREKLAAELMDASNNEGASIKKKVDTHKMAEANKAFAHFRW